MTAGFSARLLADIARLERTRNYLRPDTVKDALEAWRAYADSPARRFWLEDRTIDYCSCYVSPAEHRELLGFVAQALPRKSARELRERLRALDALY